MNLEDFPVSASALKMIGMVSGGFYDDSYVGKWIYEVMGQQLDLTQEKAGELPYQAFLSTATWGLQYWEKLVGLPVREDLDYSTRRTLIEERLDNRHPISPAWLEKFLTDVSGCKTTVTENPDTYTFHVMFEIGEDLMDLNMDLIIKKLDATKPAHLSYAIAIGTSADEDVYVGTILTALITGIVECETPDIDNRLDYGHLDAMVYF